MFFVPLVYSILNLQAFLILYNMDKVGQFLAYFNLLLISFGSISLLKKIEVLSKTAKIWFVFYILYFCIGLLAMVIFHNYTPILYTFIPLIYFIGFYIFLSIESHRQAFLKTAAIAFLVSSLLLVYFVIINFDLDFGGISLYKVDRPGGVYGDANNAALACNISYVFFNKFFIANTPFKKYIKILILLTIILSLFLTFSTTGISVFIIILFINNLDFFRGGRIILLFAAAFIMILTVVNLNSLTSGLDLTPGQRVKIDTLVNVISLNPDKVNNSGRGALLENIFIYISQNPILGNGIDFGFNQHAHNTFFMIWADAGIITFLVFIIILITYFKKSIQANIEVRYFCLSLLIAICTFMMSLHTIINQNYLIVLFPYIGYLIDNKQAKSSIPT